MYKLKTHRFIAIIHIIANDFKTNNISQENCRKAYSFSSHPYVKKHIKPTEASEKYSGDKTNINSLCDYYEDGSALLSEPVFEMFKKIKLIEDKGVFYFVFNSKEELNKFKTFKLITTFNKRIYHDEDGFLVPIIYDLIKLNNIQLLEKTINKQIPTNLPGTVGKNSKLYLTQNDNTIISSNKFSVHFSDVFDDQFLPNDNWLDNVFNKIKNNKIIELALKINSENELKNKLKEKLHPILE